MKDFRELKVWWKGHRPTLDVYEATAGFPREGMHGFTAQLRSSCASTPANMADGCGRSGDTELARFMQIAMGSASELEYQLLLALSRRAVEVKLMLSTSINKLGVKQAVS